MLYIALVKKRGSCALGEEEQIKNSGLFLVVVSAILALRHCHQTAGGRLLPCERGVIAIVGKLFRLCVCTALMLYILTIYAK